MILDYLELSIKNIRKRLLRSFLTILGIAIGIMGLIALSGLGDGLTTAVMDELTPLSDTILVNTGDLKLQGGIADQGGSLSSQNDIGKMRITESLMQRVEEFFTDRDLGDIRRVAGIKHIAQIMSDVVLVEYNHESAWIDIKGVDPEIMSEMYGSESLEQGSLLHSGEQNKCIIGASVANDYFKTPIGLNDKINLNGKKFIVKGIYKKEGGGLWYQNDVSIHLMQRDFEKVTGNQNIDSLVINVYDISKVEQIGESIISILSINHGADDLFSTITMTSILERIMQVISIIQTVLLAIASIALIVASIGIMNMMLTAVIERTNEIGVMKAIGATNKNVLYLFLAEGVTVSLIGGIFGIILGFVGSMIICTFVSEFLGTPFMAVISPFSIVLAIAVALSVGIVFSYYPAKHAAFLNPVTAISMD